MHIEGVRGGELSDADAHRFAAVVIQVRAVVFGAKFGAPDIFQAHQCPVAVALEDDVVELRCFRETADGADADLKLLAGNRRLRADLPGSDFDVLLAERIDDIGRSQRSARHAHRMEYLRSPKRKTSATPGTRLRLSRT